MGLFKDLGTLTGFAFSRPRPTLSESIAQGAAGIEGVLAMQNALIGGAITDGVVGVVYLEDVGTIVEPVPQPGLVGVRLGLVIELPGTTPYRLAHVDRVPVNVAPLVRPGIRLPVLVSRSMPNTIRVDWQALGR